MQASPILSPAQESALRAVHSLMHVARLWLHSVFLDPKELATIRYMEVGNILRLLRRHEETLVQQFPWLLEPEAGFPPNGSEVPEGPSDGDETQDTQD